MNKHFFFQDFLFENMPVDEQDNPLVNLTDLPTDIDIGEWITISFDLMLRMEKKEEWDDLFAEVRDRDVCICDDVVLNNSEIIPYKDFYLKTYFYNISKHSRNTFIKRSS